MGVTIIILSILITAALIGAVAGSDDMDVCIPSSIAVLVFAMLLAFTVRIGTKEEVAKSFLNGKPTFEKRYEVNLKGERVDSSYHEIKP